MAEGFLSCFGGQTDHSYVLHKQSNEDMYSDMPVLGAVWFCSLWQVLYNEGELWSWTNLVHNRTVN